MGEIAYYRSKLALELYTLTLSRTLPPNVKVVSLHPGVIILDHARRALSGSVPKRLLFLLLSPFIWYFFKNEWYGAQTTLECVVSDFETL
jgi:NAD(P)-dependent dehydrogenase (short-subunit alcohol dehydrogenase family)